MSGGGGGHIFDMNNRIKSNRALKNSRKKKFKQSSAYLLDKRKDNFFIQTKELSDKERKIMKQKIRFRLLKQRKKQLILLSLIFLFVLSSVTALIYLLNN